MYTPIPRTPCKTQHQATKKANFGEHEETLAMAFPPAGRANLFSEEEPRKMATTS